MESICAICGNHGSVTTVTMITCAKGCCKATRNQFGMKILDGGGDPTKCGDAAKHAAVGICGACVSTKTFQLPTEFQGDASQASMSPIPPTRPATTATNSMSQNRSYNTPAQLRSAR